MGWLGSLGLVLVLVGCRCAYGQGRPPALKRHTCMATDRGQECFMVYFAPGMSATNAEKFCREHGSGALAAITDRRTQEHIRVELRASFDDPSSTYRDFAWIGGAEVQSDTWTWLDGSPLQAKLDTHGYQNCAVMSSSAGAVPRLTSRSCTKTSNSYICAAASSECPGSSLYRVTSFEVGKDHYCLYDGRDTVSWYEARNHCLDQGQDLGSFPMYSTNASGRAIYLTNFSAIISEERWVGLRKRPWRWQHLKDLYPEAPSLFVYTNWRDGQPNSITQRCTYVDFSSAHGKWADEDCNKALAYFICQNKTDEGSSTTPISTKIASSHRMAATITATTSGLPISTPYTVSTVNPVKEASTFALLSSSGSTSVPESTLDAPALPNPSAGTPLSTSDAPLSSVGMSSQTSAPPDAESNVSVGSGGSRDTSVIRPPNTPENTALPTDIGLTSTLWSKTTGMYSTKHGTELSTRGFKDTFPVDVSGTMTTTKTTTPVKVHQITRGTEQPVTTMSKQTHKTQVSSKEAITMNNTTLAVGVSATVGDMVKTSQGFRVSSGATVPVTVSGGSNKVTHVPGLSSVVSDDSGKVTPGAGLSTTMSDNGKVTAGAGKSAAVSDDSKATPGEEGKATVSVTVPNKSMVSPGAEASPTVSGAAKITPGVLVSEGVSGSRSGTTADDGGTVSDKSDTYTVDLGVRASKSLTKEYHTVSPGSEQPPMASTKIDEGDVDTHVPVTLSTNRNHTNAGMQLLATPPGKVDQQLSSETQRPGLVVPGESTGMSTGPNEQTVPPSNATDKASTNTSGYSRDAEYTTLPIPDNGTMFSETTPIYRHDKNPDVGEVETVATGESLSKDATILIIVGALILLLFGILAIISLLRWRSRRKFKAIFSPIYLHSSRSSLEDIKPSCSDADDPGVPDVEYAVVNKKRRRHDFSAVGAGTVAPFEPGYAEVGRPFYPPLHGWGRRRGADEAAAAADDADYNDYDDARDVQPRYGAGPRRAVSSPEIDEGRRKGNPGQLVIALHRTAPDTGDTSALVFKGKNNEQLCMTDIPRA